MPGVLEQCKKLPSGFGQGKEMPIGQDKLLDMPGNLDQDGEMLCRLDKLLDIPSNVDLRRGGERTESLCHGGDLPGDVMPSRLGPGGGPGVSWCPAYWLLGRENRGQRTEDREGAGKIVPDQEPPGCPFYFE